MAQEANNNNIIEENETPPVHPKWQTSARCKRIHIQDEIVSSSETDDTIQMRHKHALDMLSLMHAMHQRRELCDVVLEVQGRRIPAHRLVLAACSPYFNAMFTSELRECREEVVTMKDMDPVAMEEIVNFAYSAKLNVNADNVQAVMKAACVLQIEPVVVISCDFLKTQLHASNCLGIRSFAEAHGCFELQQVADSFAGQNFTKVAQHEEFLQLTTEEIISLIERDSLNVSKEEEVYNAVMTWLNHDREARIKTIGKVFEYVRLPLLAWEFLNSKVVEDKLVLTDEKCVKFYDEARRYHASQFYPGLHWEVNVRTLPRHSFSQSPFIYIVGGETSPGCTLSSVERYTPAIRNWTTISPMPTSRRAAGTVILDQILYVIGGANSSALKNTECFDFQTDSWRTLAPMHECRSSVAVAAVGGYLYACGGYDGNSSLRTAEQYNPNSNEWQYIPDMLTPRSMAGAVAHGKYVYIIGGYNGSTDMQSVERYIPHTRQWEAVAAMHSPRSMVNAVVFKDLIYVVGGCDHSLSLSSVEVYNPSTNTWIQVGMLNHPRSGMGVAVVGKRLYALGGYDGSEYLRSVERYEDEKDEWTVIGSMESPRRRFGCCA